MSQQQLILNQYYIPLKPRLTFTNLKGDQTYFTFDGFISPANTLNVIYTDAERAGGESGIFNIVVEDSANLIQRDHLRNTRVLLEFGKSTNTYQPFMVAFADILRIRRPRNFYMEYLLTGPSSKIQAAELMLLIRRATKKISNPDYGIGNLIIDMATKRKSRPLDKEDIEEITHWSIDLVSDGGGIADEANQVFLTIVNEVFSTLWDFLDRMSALVGMTWDIDYDAEWKQMLTFKSQAGRSVDVIVKSRDLKASTDDPRKVSYIKEGFEIEDNSTSDAGVATRLYTTTTIDQQSIFAQMSNGGFVDLVSRAVAQQAVIENDQRRITDIAFIMSKIGDPKSPKDRVNGDLVLDGGDNTPTGQTLATFNIPLSDIKTQPDTIFVDLADKVKVRFLDGEHFIWARLFQRSGVDGDPNTDSANTVRVHHNGQLNTPQTYFSAISTGPTLGDYKLKDSMTWASTQNGPTFDFEIFSRINRLQSRTNPTQAKVLRVKERYIDSSPYPDFRSVNRFLSLNLADTSHTRRTIDNFRVTVPDSFLFKPYQVVSFADGLSGESGQMQLSRSRITVSALPGDINTVLGAYWQEISLTSSFNSLLGSCSCL